MIEITDKSKCCGCEACAQKCPKQCIILKEDEDGFRYPYVDKKKCIDCHLCEKTCPVINQFEEKYPIDILACKNKNERIRLESSSGGLFLSIASRIIQNKGIVYGVKYDKDWNIVFSSAETTEGIKEFQGSKYAQAYVGETYANVERDLKNEKPVLFVGASCQVAALKRYLRKNYDNLFTIDFICHGVPSQALYKRFLYEEVLKKGYVITKINMRDKTKGWREYRFVIEGYKTTKTSRHILLYKPFVDTTYGKLFLSDVVLRPSCHSCCAKSGRSDSDLTLADFWGVWNTHPDKNDNRGLTLAIINKERGKKLLDFESIDYFRPSFEEAFATNGGYFKSTYASPKRENVISDLRNGHSLKYVKDKFFPISPYVQIKKFIKEIIK